MLGFRARSWFARRYGWIVDGVAVAILGVVAVTLLPLRELAHALPVVSEGGFLVPVSGWPASAAARVPAAVRDGADPAGVDDSPAGGSTRDAAAFRRARSAEVGRRHQRFAVSHLAALEYPAFVPVALLDVEPGPTGTVGIAGGRGSGIRVGDPVLFGEYLVGLISSVGTDHSRFRKIAHPEHRLAAVVHHSVARYRELVRPFALQGSRRHGGVLELRIFRDWDTLTDSMPVATGSHDTQRIPAGLRIGDARPLRDPSDRVVFSGIVEPAVDCRLILHAIVLPSAASDAGAGASAAVEAGAEAWAAHCRSVDVRDPARHAPWKVIDAQVVRTRDLSAVRLSATLDRGRRHGVVVDAAVVVDGRYVGRVSHVATDRCRFRLLADTGMDTFVLGSADGNAGRQQLAVTIAPKAVLGRLRGLGAYAGDGALELELYRDSNARGTVSALSGRAPVYTTAGIDRLVPGGLAVDVTPVAAGGEATSMDARSARSVLRCRGGRIAAGTRVEIWVRDDGAGAVAREVRP